MMNLPSMKLFVEIDWEVKWRIVNFVIYIVFGGTFIQRCSECSKATSQSAAAFLLMFFYEEQSRRWGSAVELHGQIFSIGKSESCVLFGS